MNIFQTEIAILFLIILLNLGESLKPRRSFSAFGMTKNKFESSRKRSPHHTSKTPTSRHQEAASKDVQDDKRISGCRTTRSLTDREWELMTILSHPVRL
jgi:hypothetical protein